MNRKYGIEERGSKLKLTQTIADELISSVEDNSNVVFSVQASGESLDYCWQFKDDNGTWKIIQNSNSSSLKLQEITPEMDGSEFRCKISNSSGVVYSDTVVLSVSQPTAPSITTQPSDTTINPGSYYNSEARFASYVYVVGGDSSSGGSSEGTTDYNDLENKPTINGITIEGAVDLTDLGIDVDSYLTSDSLSGYATTSSLSTVATSGLFDDLENIPTINNVSLSGDLSLEDLGITAESLGLSSTFEFKGTVSSVGDLPTDDNSNGDTYFVSGENVNYSWNGEAWVESGGSIDLSSYATIDYVDEKFNSIEIPEVDLDGYATLENLAEKQDTLTAGSNITIEDNVISATGLALLDASNLSDENIASWKSALDVSSGGGDSADLTNYYDKDEVDNLIEDKVSTDDYTNANSIDVDIWKDKLGINDVISSTVNVSANTQTIIGSVDITEDGYYSFESSTFVAGTSGILNFSSEIIVCVQDGALVNFDTTNVIWELVNYLSLAEDGSISFYNIATDTPDIQFDASNSRLNVLITTLEDTTCKTDITFTKILDVISDTDDTFYETTAEAEIATDIIIGEDGKTDIEFSSGDGYYKFYLELYLIDETDNQVKYFTCANLFYYLNGVLESYSEVAWSNEISLLASGTDRYFFDPTETNINPEINKNTTEGVDSLSVSITPYNIDTLCKARVSLEKI